MPQPLNETPPDFTVGMPLLAPILRIFLKPLPNGWPVRVELARRCALARLTRREVTHLQIFLHGITRYPVHFFNIADAAPITALVLYRINSGHADHLPLRPSIQKPLATNNQVRLTWRESARLCIKHRKPAVESDGNHSATYTLPTSPENPEAPLPRIDPVDPSVNHITSRF